MANIYVRSTDGSDADNGSTWALAKATLAGAFAIAAAGDTVWVSQVHAESQAGAMTLTSPGTAGSWVKVLCGNDGAEPPTALATTATVSVTGNVQIGFAGYAYVYGVTFQCITSNGASAFLQWISTSAWGWIYDSCALSMASTSASVRMTVGNTTVIDSRIVLINTPISFGNASQGIIVITAVFEWYSTASALGGTVPTKLFLAAAGERPMRVLVDSVDLSAMGSGKSLLSAARGACDLFTFRNCKLGASVSLTTGSFSGPGSLDVLLENCDSGSGNTRYQRSNYNGDITTETTIVLDASDGTTPISRKVVTSANVSFFNPLKSDPIIGWNNTTGSSMTATVEIVNDGTTLKDNEVWLEVEYLGNSSFPIATIGIDRATNILTTAANQTTSTASWTTTGLASPVKQSLDVTFTPQLKGPFYARVCVAKASQTLYFNPRVGTGVVTDGREYQANGAYLNEPSTSGGGGLAIPVSGKVVA